MTSGFDGGRSEKCGGWAERRRWSFTQSGQSEAIERVRKSSNKVESLEVAKVLV